MEKAHVVVLVAAALGATMVAVGSHAQNVRYPVQVSPIKPAGPTNIHRSLYWIDNDSVLFAATPGDIRGTSNPAIQMVIWNSRDDSIKTLGQQATAFRPFCYSDGFVRFATRIDAGDVVFKEGMLTSLSEKRIPRDEIQSDADRKRGEMPSRFTCNSYKVADLGPRGRCLIPLRDGDGYVDLTGGVCAEKFTKSLEEIAKLPDWDTGRARSQRDDELRAQPASYLETPTGAEIPMPFKAGEVGARDVQYSVWSSSYVIRADNTVPRAPGSIWPKGQPRPIYLLTRGGTVQRVDMPYTDWNKGRMAAAVLTRAGVLVLSHEIGRNYDVGHAGIYRIAHHNLEPVFRGYVAALAVSPSGCKVAAVSQDRKSFAFRLNSIDVCIGRG